MYHVRLVDRAGSPWTHAVAETYSEACAIARSLPQYGHRDFNVWVENPDRIDIDCPNGLTDEEIFGD